VVVAFNEEQQIGERLRNLLSSEYPAENLKVLLVSDGSTDATVSEGRAMSDERVMVVEQRERRGKAAGLNLALAQCAGEIVVFTDARQRFAPDAITKLVSHFADPNVGAVSGELEIAPAESATGAGVDVYWRYERALRAAEARFDSCIGCSGAIYALRRELFRPIPEDTLLDDVVIPMQAALQGRRVLHDAAARAFDPRTLEPQAEHRRKERTLAGGFQMALRYPGWLFPWKNRLWWQLFSHKYLRLVAPVFLASALVSNVALWGGGYFYEACLVVQIALYGFALLGLAGWKARVAKLASGFVFLNAMTLMGFVYYCTRKTQRGWS
jgi:cellulose synthase/poly-beta-1,6-N-acetylglucosamine synthase-like glycosyltransferase